MLGQIQEKRIRYPEGTICSVPTPHCPGGANLLGKTSYVEGPSGSKANYSFKACPGPGGNTTEPLWICPEGSQSSVLATTAWSEMVEGQRMTRVYWYAGCCSPDPDYVAREQARQALAAEAKLKRGLLVGAAVLTAAGIGWYLWRKR